MHKIPWSEKTPDYFDGNNYIQHNISIADGLDGLGTALQALQVSERDNRKSPKEYSGIWG